MSGRDEPIGVEIRWTDVDAFSHVHHVAMLAILEHARSKWVDRRLNAGQTWDYAVVRLTVNYRSELRYEDRLAHCEFAVERVGTSSVTLAETILGPNSRLVAEGSSVIVAWEPATGKTRPLGADELEALRPA
jgi:YbgC/YbaW family acyl-CoA thioester hydrolase